MDPHVAELLDIDLDDPEVQREEAAIDRDMGLIETLVGIRRQRGMTQAEVAERMGCGRSAAADFEWLGGDPHLSTIRRHALAIGVDVLHTVGASGEVAETSSTPTRIQVCGWETETPRTVGTATIDLKPAALRRRGRS